MFDLAEHPHRRYNPLINQWVLVSPHRVKRTWQGKTEPPPQTAKNAYDPACYLCPGNARISGEINPDYSEPYVFDNDFSALLPDTPKYHNDDDPLFCIQSVRGTGRVVCFSPDHSKTLPELPLQTITALIGIWQRESRDLARHYRWVQIFENKGEAMGSSSIHPHGQIWAGDFLPSELVRVDESQREYYKKYGRPLLLDYVQHEMLDGTRTVVETEYWLAVVPYWAFWPFETLLLPKIALQRLTDLNAEQSADLALALKKLTCRYDNLFQCSFPYAMGFHGAPYDEENKAHWQCHAHFYPPLLRSAEVRKFMAGYEMLAEAQRDFTPEQAAQRLQEVSDSHYSESLD